MKTVVFTPTWNESENIELLVRNVFKHLPDAHLLVVDDQSPDGTGRIVSDLQKEFPNLHLLLRSGRRGRGWAGIAGYIWGLDDQADVLVEMDADFSHQPMYLPALIKGLANADMAIGSRYVPGGKDMRRGLVRRSISRMANLYQQIMFGTHVRDCTSGFRAYRARLLEQIGVRKLSTWGPAILSDVLYRAILLNFKLKEIPIEFPDRERGSSTFTFRIMLEGILNVARLRFRKRALFNQP